MRTYIICASVILVGILAVPVFAVNWTTPVPVESGINTGAVEWTPYLSYDGKSLYFSRQDGSVYNIYEAKRSQPSGNFTSVSRALSSSGHVLEPWISPDNLRMYYHQESGSWQVKMSQRTSINDAWPQGTVISGLPSNICSPTLSEDELTIIYNNPNIGGWDIYIATRPSRDSAFSNSRSLSELNTASIESSPSLSPDGLSLYFFSDRNGLGRIFEATRQSLYDPFGAPVLISDIPYGAHCPSINISSDGKALYFGMGATPDIYVSYYIPEPASIALLGLGVFILRRKSKN
jgi:hypothetical protein